MQIGRVTGLPEPTGFAKADESSVAFNVLATPVQARQLLGHGSNRAERFVPVVFGSWGAEHSGIYELLSVQADADTGLQAAGLRQVAVAARAVNRGRQVANGVLLVRGDNRERTAQVGVTGPIYRAHVPDGASNLTSFNTGPGRFTVAGSVIATLGRGSVRRITDGSQVKAAVRVATTANITSFPPSGTITIDGVSVSTTGNRVLVKNQTDATQNGIWERKPGTWERATDANLVGELDRAIVYVTQGTANGGTTWQTPNEGITPGTTANSWQQAPVWGLRESPQGGPVSIAYGQALTTQYNGACTVTQGGEVVTGTTLPAATAVTVDNGLVRLVDNQISMASGSTLAWRSSRTLTAVVLAEGFTAEANMAFGSPTLVTNTPDLVTVRYRLSGDVTGAVDLSMMRGSRTVTASFSLDRPCIVSFGPGSFVLVGLQAGSGVGYTSPVDHMQYQSSNDADGNRWGISYAGKLSPLTDTFKRSHVFGVHAVVGGGGTLTGDDKLFDMDRAWFAMLSQQTSAGVL